MAKDDGRAYFDKLRKELDAGKGSSDAHAAEQRNARRTDRELRDMIRRQGQR